MVKNTAKLVFSLIFSLCFVFAGEQDPQYDNLSYGVPGKADTIVNRPGYALGYIEYHEQPAWVIYIMTREEATTKAAKRSDRFKPDPQIPTGAPRWPTTAGRVTIADTLLLRPTWPFLGKQWPTASS